MKILLVGVVTREIAQSAVAAGYEVISLDYFGDSDLLADAQVYSLVRDFLLEPTHHNLILGAKTFSGAVDKIVVGAGVENEPGLLEICGFDKYWSNSASTIKKVRDPLFLSKFLQNQSLSFPKTLSPHDKLPNIGEWLVKDQRCSGGLGIREWDGQRSLQEYEVLQEKINGDLMSANFLSDGKSAILIGLTRQYAGVQELGVPPFYWCGNTAPYMDKNLEKEISQVLNNLAQECEIVGVNGIDFILQDEIPYLLEINPRWTGSLELFERLYGLNMFRLHVNACRGELPESLPSLPDQTVIGKGILYADRDITLGDTSTWRNRCIADIPHACE